MFTNAFLHQLQPFSTIRFMDWMDDDRFDGVHLAAAHPATSFLSTGPAGVPYEDMIELANESQKDMWINIPALATPNYVQNLAQLIDSRARSQSQRLRRVRQRDLGARHSGVHASSSSRQVEPAGDGDKRSKTRSNSRAPTRSQRTD